MPEVFTPTSLKEALALREEYHAVPIAGGSDIMVREKRWKGLTPSLEKPIILLSYIDELKKLEIENDSMRIGACFTLGSLERFAGLPKPLYDAVLQMAAPTIRNVATLGGNICNASPAGDTLPFLYGVNAELRLVSLHGERTLPIHEFIAGPGETRLNEDELLSDIYIPLNKTSQPHYYLYKKVGTRKAQSLSKIAFLGMVNYSGVQENNVTTIEGISCVFGAIAPRVIRSIEAESLITGKKPSEIQELLPVLHFMYEQLMDPIDDQRSTAIYRKRTAIRLLDAFLKSVQDRSRNVR